MANCCKGYRWLCVTIGCLQPIVPIAIQSHPLLCNICTLSWTAISNCKISPRMGYYRELTREDPCHTSWDTLLHAQSDHSDTFHLSNDVLVYLLGCTFNFLCILVTADLHWPVIKPSLPWMTRKVGVSLQGGARIIIPGIYNTPMGSESLNNNLYIHTYT